MGKERERQKSELKLESYMKGFSYSTWQQMALVNFRINSYREDGVNTGFANWKWQILPFQRSPHNNIDKFTSRRGNHNRPRQATLTRYLYQIHSIKMNVCSGNCLRNFHLFVFVDEWVVSNFCFLRFLFVNVVLGFVAKILWLYFALWFLWCFVFIYISKGSLFICLILNL